MSGRSSASDEQRTRTGEQELDRVRTYTLTLGRTSARMTLSLDTVLEAGSGRPGPGQPQECRDIVAWCREHRRSVAELAGLLGRPVFAVKILISDLLHAGALTLPLSSPHTPSGDSADHSHSTQLLAAVAVGLRRKFPDAVSHLRAG